mmetsp:Transcript_35569/g.100690  ORF Transcript_35569/g.100690 Transcript_35569/m.100690 type:complete len:281 (+) Transcript_35569:226-1068(+)
MASLHHPVHIVLGRIDTLHHGTPDTLTLLLAHLASIRQFFLDRLDISNSPIFHLPGLLHQAIVLFRSLLPPMTHNILRIGTEGACSIAQRVPGHCLSGIKSLPHRVMNAPRLLPCLLASGGQVGLRGLYVLSNRLLRPADVLRYVLAKAVDLLAQCALSLVGAVEAYDGQCGAARGHGHTSGGGHCPIRGSADTLKQSLLLTNGGLTFLGTHKVGCGVNQLGSLLTNGVDTIHEGTFSLLRLLLGTVCCFAHRLGDHGLAVLKALLQVFLNTTIRNHNNC